ncbi:MAG: undecaprenyl/decaprenyl-phosphate alpha-N-acetylglucosaminyl 1-phosphate transferase [Chloroflexia bacterium]|nr:undecaprenyl/decaprenyl-phosphate alpha-N-acetylglucosaminyl 1-phosphate transferase [Chloroflexia bacterium]
MSHALIAGTVFVIAAAVSTGAMRPILAFAQRFSLFDMPEARRVHTVPIPRIGGLAIYFGFIIAIAISFMLPVLRFAEEIERILLLIVAATLVVAVMLFDDVFGVPPIPKLLFQIAAAGIVVFPRVRNEQAGIVIETFNVPFIDTVELPLTIAILFTLFWIVGMMNAVNWADGLDGLAGSVTLIAAVILFLHTYFRPPGDPQFTISLLAIALAGAIVGFLPWNWHPARIIMGDTGAMFLGFALATISVVGGAKIATALLALGVPILDMAWVILYRVINGRSPLYADRGHLHHRLLDAGLSQTQIVAVFAMLTAVFGTFALALPTREMKLFAMLGMGAVVLALVAALARRKSSGNEIDEIA